MPTDLILRRAARTLRGGGVIAYPTEGVYGLGCNPHREAAVQTILAIKGRSARAGLILIASHREQLEQWIAPTAMEERRLRSRTPKPVTWIVTAVSNAPRIITGGRSTIAVRLTRHPLAARLCDLAGMAIVSTSANRHGRPPARSALAVRRRLGHAVHCVVPGRTAGLDRPTEIRSARTGQVLRPG